MDWNYYDTFITVSADCPASRGIAPPDKKSGKTKAGIEYDLLVSNPYLLTQEELLYQVYLKHKAISGKVLEEKGTEIRDEFFQTPKPCMRASMLPKKFGWGIHFDSEGRIGLYSLNSEEYDRFAAGDGGRVKVLAAMRNRRK